MSEETGVLRPKPSTIGDVAALAGVDRAVVSRLINADPRLRIRDSTRQRVIDAIDELGYQPNAAARSLRTSRTRTLALLVPDYANPAYGEIIRGAERAAAAVGSSLLTASLETAEDSFERYAQRIGHGRVDGLLLASGSVDGTPEEEIARLGVPWLFVNRTGPGRRRYVVLDDERATEVAVQHLLDLGHRHLGFISGPSRSDSAERRRLAFIAAMRAAGLDADVIAHADYTAEGGAHGMQEILDREDRPSAVLVANVASAVGALHTARRKGVRVPGDLSVMAIHDVTIAAFLDPPLTTIRMSLDGLGARAVELLLEREPGAAIHEVFAGPVELLTRESTAPPHG